MTLHSEIDIVFYLIDVLFLHSKDGEIDHYHYIDIDNEHGDCEIIDRTPEEIQALKGKLDLKAN